MIVLDTLDVHVDLNKSYILTRECSDLIKKIRDGVERKCSS